LVGALEEVELLFNVISDTGTGTSIPPLAPLHVFAPALEVNYMYGLKQRWAKLF
jgi:hypothetical protein